MSWEKAREHGERVEDFRNDLDEHIAEVEGHIEEEKRLALEALASAWNETRGEEDPELSAGDLAMGEAWECPEDPHAGAAAVYLRADRPNPLVRCVYNESEDPAHDRCLFCGHPEERK